MAHGQRAERIGHISREYWSRRPGSMGNWGKASKVFTHRLERVMRRRMEWALRFVANTHGGKEDLETLY